MAAKLEFVLDCVDPDRAAAFWSAALGYEIFGSVENYRSIVDPDGVSPKIILQGVDEAKTIKNRMHLDIQIDDIEAEATRLIALGAVRLEDEPYVEHGTAWILMADPEGNEFCVCEAGS